jgi:kinesin family protein 5
VVSKLEAIEGGSPPSALTVDDAGLLRRQLTEGAGILRESLERAQMAQDELELVRRRRDEAESRLSALETEYEELLGMSPLHGKHLT